MTTSETTSRPLAIARAALQRPRAPFQTLPDRLVVVDAAMQRLTVLLGGRAIAEYPVSTARAGVGGLEGSHCTPPGWHRIHRRIGDGEPIGALFVSREPTGAVWHGDATDADLILTRVLTLEGLEEGVNCGPGKDSLERYIYIHGTNHPEQLGKPVSHGCVRLANEDIVAMFDQVREGDAVVIVEEPIA